MLLMYYPQCSTCKKALKWLNEHGVHYESRNIKTEKPSAEELRTWHQLSGMPLTKFFNTHGKLYRDLHLKTKLPMISEEEMINLLSSDGMMVKRPLLILDDQVLIGFNEEKWQEAL